LEHTPSTNNKSDDSGRDEEYVAVMPEIMPEEQLSTRPRRDISQPRTQKQATKCDSSPDRERDQERGDREQPRDRLKKDRSHTPNQQRARGDRPKTAKPQASSFVSPLPQSQDEFNPLQYLDEERCRHEQAIKGIGMLKEAFLGQQRLMKN
jgi:hypothetical protein